MTGFSGRLKDSNGLTFVGAPSALAAKLIERHGFDGVYLSGAGLAMNRVPDDGTIIKSLTYWRCFGFLIACS